MSGGIFISYRRDDSRQAAGRLADELAQAFGRENIFRDIEKIEIGVDFTQALEKALAECEVMLVLIGRHWSGIVDAQGQRRLDQPEDWIRSEIVTALKRNVRVVPVLVDGAKLPEEAELPEDMKPLLRRQALELDDGRWRGDVTRLVEGLGRLPGLAPKTVAEAAPVAQASARHAGGDASASGTKNRRLLFAIGGVAALGLAMALIDWSGDGHGEDTAAPIAQAASVEQPQDDVRVWRATTRHDWVVRFTDWSTDKPHVEIRDTGLGNQLIHVGTASFGEGNRFVTDLKATAAFADVQCEWVLNENETELNGHCKHEDDEPFEMKLVPQ